MRYGFGPTAQNTKKEEKGIQKAFWREPKTRHERSSSTTIQKMRKIFRLLSIIICILPVLAIGIVGGFFRLLGKAWRESVFYYQTGKFREE